jgi:hypothetical protein
MSWKRLSAAWLLLAVLMPLNGAVREFWLKDFLAAPAADVISAVSGAALILIVTRLVFRIAPDTPDAALWRMGAVLVAATVAYEFAAGLLGGQSWPEMLANYALWRGRLWPLVLLTLGLTPFLWRPRRR